MTSIILQITLRTHLCVDQTDLVPTVTRTNIWESIPPDKKAVTTVITHARPAMAKAQMHVSLAKMDRPSIHVAVVLDPAYVAKESM